MQQWTRRLHAVNKSAGRRWSPIPQPPPPHVDRLCGTHSVLNTLRAFYNSPQQQHPHRKQLRRLFVRDFRLAFDRPGDAHREDGDGSSNPNENNTSNAISGGSCRSADECSSGVWVPPQYPNLQRIICLARALGLDVRPVERRELVQLCGERRNQNVVLEVSAYTPKDVAACPWPRSSSSSSSSTDKGRHATGGDVVLFLDHVVDPANVGAIMRSAFFLGVQRVVLSSDSAGCTAAVARASTGFVEHMEVYRSVMPTTAFLENTIAQHKARGDARKLCIYGATATPWRTAGQQRQQQQHQGEESGLPPRRLVLLGNEDKGLPLEVLRLCTHAVHVPSLRQREQRQQQQKQHQQHGRVEAVTSEGGGVGVKEQKAGEVLVEDAATLRPQEVSLNVSAASAVVLVALLAGGQAVEVHPIQ